MTSLTESDVEAAALEWLAGLGWGSASVRASAAVGRVVPW